VVSRVKLVEPCRGDRAAWCELVRTSRRLFVGRVSTAATASAFAAVLARAGNPAGEYRLIRRKADDVLLGAIALSEIVRGKFQSGYLGYYLGAAYTGQGYMTEAVQLMLAIAFRRLRLHRVEANVQPNNRASIRLIQRAGFRREGYSPRYLKIGGRWRDHERWALLAEDWRPFERSSPAARL
jgi:[ribosomal protein S5]-alanine N-acetyltransferase